MTLTLKQMSLEGWEDMDNSSICFGIWLACLFTSLNHHSQLQHVSMWYFLGFCQTKNYGLVDTNSTYFLLSILGHFYFI